jgi:uncharacterized peroxidase-related enzyme
MSRDDERSRRAQQTPIVGGLPEVPGIGAAMRLKPELGLHLRGLADQLLVHDFPGATISRYEREVLATAVSAGNDCFFCMDSHAAHATALLAPEERADAHANLDVIKQGGSAGFGPKMQALLRISRTVRADPLRLTADDVAAAHAAGATDGDVQLAVLIAAGFAMYNRMVDGLRARTPGSTELYHQRAAEIAANGYSAPPAGPAGGVAPSPEAAPSRA